MLIAKFFQTILITFLSVIVKLKKRKGDCSISENGVFVFFFKFLKIKSKRSLSLSFSDLVFRGKKICLEWSLFNLLLLLLF